MISTSPGAAGNVGNCCCGVDGVTHASALSPLTIPSWRMNTTSFEVRRKNHSYLHTGADGTKCDALPERKCLWVAHSMQYVQELSSRVDEGYKAHMC